jgi:hypothetical protein
MEAHVRIRPAIGSFISYKTADFIRRLAVKD